MIALPEWLKSPTWVKPMAVSLGIGVAGGAAFNAIGAPMPWILGAMTANIAAAMAGMNTRVPMPLVSVMIAVLGVMSGSSFGPGFIERLPQWTTSLSVVLAFVFIVAGATYVVLRRLFGYSMLTAYFCASPGGLNMMAVLGQAMGGDVRQIALVHSTRLALTLAVISGWLSFTGHGDVDTTHSGESIADFSYTDMGLMVACMVVGVLVANRLKMDGGNFIGPLLLSAAIHMAGISEFQAPGILAAVAQVVMGSGIGTRFTGTTLKRVVGTVAIGVLTAAIALGFTVGMTVALAGPLDVPSSALLLSLAPAGFPMMVLAAIALNLDVAFVTTHQLARVAIIILIGPPLIRFIAKKSGIAIRNLSKE